MYILAAACLSVLGAIVVRIKLRNAPAAMRIAFALLVFYIVIAAVSVVSEVALHGIDWLLRPTIDFIPVVFINTPLQFSPFAVIIIIIAVWKNPFENNV